MKAKYKAGDKVVISDSSRLSGMSATIESIDLEYLKDVPYYWLKMDEPINKWHGARIGRSQYDIKPLTKE